jgi:hypothetical protein
MPTKTRWTLNPKKWFGVKSKTKHQQEINISPIIRAPFTATTTTRTAASTISQIISGRNKVQVVPMPSPNEIAKNNPVITQLQLPAFSVRRERTSTTFQRQTTFHPTPTEPTIRKRGRIEGGGLSIDVSRFNIPTAPANIYEHFSVKQVDANTSNTSHRCVIDYPTRSPNRIEECSLPSRSSSASSNNEDNDHSSSSGVFTDERPRTASKDTLSTLEVLSIESIPDSPTSSKPSQTRPIIHHYRRPMSVFDTIEDKPEQSRSSFLVSNRSQSAEGILKENPPKSRQTSVVIIKKSEKRSPTLCPPSAKFERAGIVRIANATYRLSPDKIDPSQKKITNSFGPFSNYDDSLPPANDEECYASLPRTTSTEYLNNMNRQNDLRMIVNECIRPMISSIEKTPLIKPHHRFKRTHGQTPLNIDSITDKLLSSVDYSIYTRYERCN